MITDVLKLPKGIVMKCCEPDTQGKKQDSLFGQRAKKTLHPLQNLSPAGKPLPLATVERFGHSVVGYSSERTWEFV